MLPNVKLQKRAKVIFYKIQKGLRDQKKGKVRLGYGPFQFNVGSIPLPYSFIS